MKKIPVPDARVMTKGSSLTETTEQELLKKLKKFEESNKFINPKLSLSLLATHLGTNTNYLSEVINTNKGKNYNNYINELRIDYICSKILNDSLYRKYKVSYLAEKCGFTSYSSFTTVFKNINGISPSIFIKQVEQSIKENATKHG